ncbi:hypothetical protein KIP69_01555 [Geobacter sulfurreducens]|uniref:hypothetical protein n=1 Tax=Geobacter sulfurreducens TaxID=35554 RepID=UPI0001D8F3D7|nr:hypothetical protein [Geobacter sulfurreducens]ADI83134.1 hypothetical protein KN400_0271 [Geobacter sulfurreducens KN400]QVW35565.1 hypothetical protein KIP69_01555 [Geobacter sulfurreducens]
MPHRLHLEQFGPVHALPVLHYRLEFAHLVREAVRRVKPDCIAIELPSTIEAPFLRAVERLPEISVIHYEGRQRRDGAESVYLLVEPADPLVEGARLALERRIPLRLVDVDTDSYPRHVEALPDSYAIHRIGLTPYYEEYRRAAASVAPGREDRRRERGMAWRLQELAKEHGSILFVCGMYHLERIKDDFGRPQAAPLERVRRQGVRLFNLHPDSCREILDEFPFISAVHELRRGPLPPEPDDRGETLRKRFSAFELIVGGRKDLPAEELLRHAVERGARHAGRGEEFPDRQRIIFRLFQEAARHYRQETGDPVHLWQKRAFFRFARNYALASGALLPDLFQLLMAARGCVDDNFAYALWRLATFYHWQRAEADIPTISISPEEIWGGSRRIRFRPRERRRKGLSHLGFLKRKKEKRPGEWLEGFTDPSICSYPPEDVLIEEYGRFLKKKGAMQLSEELSRTEPFTSSLLDGIDLRETLRNVADGRVYVRESQRAKGGVGSVVVIFDEDRENGNYPYRTTWLGEHEQESDMAFYATPPEDNIVGPGICRCEYGGFLLSSPPRRMMDVWRDPDYVFARSKPEVLLLAALDYSPEKHVVHVAARPPRSIFRQIAARMGKKIVHIPLGSLSSVKLKSIRVLHILHGHDKRQVAKDYIW